MSDWSNKKLVDVVEKVQTGSTPSTKQPEFFGGNIQWFTPSDIGQSKFLNKSERTITQSAISNGKAKIFPEGALLVTCIGNIGRVGLIQTPASSNQQITGLTFKKDIHPDYAYYWFLVHQPILEKMANQAVVPIINNDRLLELDFYYPSLDEQRRISRILDQADRLRRLRRHARQQTDTFLQSVFIEMFGDPATNPKDWTVVQIEDVVTLAQYGTSDKSNQEGKGYPVLGMGNITYEGQLDLSNFAYVDLPAKEFEKLRLEPGDILFNRTNSTELVGKCTYWNLPMDAVLASYLVKLKLTDNVSPVFFSTLLNTPHYKRLFRERCKKAVGQSNISPTLLKEFKMMLPPIEEQRHFEQLARRTEQLLHQHQESERQAEMNFKALLQRAFNGELSRETLVV